MSLSARLTLSITGIHAPAGEGKMAKSTITANLISGPQTDVRTLQGIIKDLKRQLAELEQVLRDWGHC